MIEATGLTKDFVSRQRTVHAVRGVDLRVERGELVAVLGPNGAGKTTLLRMLTTLTPPTAGSARVAGHDVVARPHAVRRSIGFVGQGNGAGHVQRARDELVTHGLMMGLDRGTSGARADELLDVLDLADQARQKVSDLSGGQRRRLDVAMGLVHTPPLLFLDEPSTGLDPQNRANLWEHVRRLRERHGVTIVLTTHYLDEADSMAERVVVVDHGRVIADATADELKRDLAGDRVVVTAPDADSAARLATLARALPGTRDAERDGVVVTLRVARATAAVAPLVEAAVREGVRVGDVETHRPTLDDVFLHLTGRSLRESAISTEASDDAGKDAA
ncbi:ATP-binding cassette domain-containing protein [Cellulomonas carbonis]|uniref:ABC transporter n=1 Tax=Cellulomonas carbonis T26 TaxID=947969 RepID=A0A0A0BPT6_9CELL|nr:ATP-binding cassette domain-containing protein [Cellulomonas carbonis]KGM10498.1 ABC transporter [Cellulomonas carbonis T26]GGC03321.1 ABC transporter [Cellulomonas carbonis]